MNGPKDNLGEDGEDEPACIKPATNLALKYGFVTDLTSLVVEENEKYLIKTHDPEKFKYDIIKKYQVEYTVVSLPLETTSNPNFQELESKTAESGKKRFFAKPIQITWIINHKFPDEKLFLGP